MKSSTNRLSIKLGTLALVDLAEQALEPICQALNDAYPEESLSEEAEEALIERFPSISDDALLRGDGVALLSLERRQAEQVLQYLERGRSRCVNVIGLHRGADRADATRGLVEELIALVEAALRQ